jgi:hypothetical protein
MKTIAIALLAALSLTTACATDTEYHDGAPGLRPGFKPELEKTLDDNSDRPEIIESFDLADEKAPAGDKGIDDGRIVWAEISDVAPQITIIHTRYEATGVETIETIDDGNP